MTNKTNCVSSDVTNIMSKTGLWQKYISSKDENIKHEIILKYIYLVKYIAGRLAVKLPAVLSNEDLESCGMIGLMEAIEKYDPGLGIDFEAFASRRIRGAMYDEIRKLNWIPRTTWQKINNLFATREKMEQKLSRRISDKELAAEAGITMQELHSLGIQFTRLTSFSLENYLNNREDNLSLSNILPDPDSPDPLSIVCDKDELSTLSKVIASLDQRDQTILALYYQEGLTLKEIGLVLGVTESRVCQLHSRAIARVRSQLTRLSGE